MDLFSRSSARRISARSWRIALASALISTSGCAGTSPDRQVPPFARVPYEGFRSANAVGIALHEWRGFGSRVDDASDARESAPDEDGETESPERAPGNWQRVGEYWWLGQDTGTRESAWTGLHDEHGRPFRVDEDAEHAWSAAFISYVMREAGAGDRFPYAPAHWAYIDAAKRASQASTDGDVPLRWKVRAERPEVYAPRPGDLVCMGRLQAAGIRFGDLPYGRFPAHCDLVVANSAGTLAVVGGNVADAVTMRHVPVTAEGRLAEADGRVVDTRFPWFVVVRVLYDDHDPHDGQEARHAVQR